MNKEETSCSLVVKVMMRGYMLGSLTLEIYFFAVW